MTKKEQEKNMNKRIKRQIYRKTLNLAPEFVCRKHYFKACSKMNAIFINRAVFVMFGVINHKCSLFLKSFWKTVSVL